MNRENKAKLLAELLNEDPDESGIEKKLEEIDSKLRQILPVLDLLSSFFVLQQKDFCEARGISPDALRSKILSGEVDFLQADGSRLNYIPLKASEVLKPRKKRSR